MSSRADSKDEGDQTAKPIKYSSTPYPLINTLKVDLLSENSLKYIPCLPNAREPMPFETEFFKGVATLIIRTSPVDEYFKSFFMGKRQFEVQVQGKFKREPLGEIYVGAEVTHKMEMGMITRSISKAALRFCGTMVNDLHYSFGDATSDPNHQVPHLVAPIFPTFDKVLVTPPGGVLPTMNVPFTEDLDYRKQRMKFRLTSDAKIDINNTYSFSVNTSNLNLLDWTLVGIPMVRPMDLRTFVSNASIQLVGYEIPHSVVVSHPNCHPKKLLNYVFSMRLTPIEPDSLPVMDFPLGSSDDEGEEVQDDDAPPATLERNSQLLSVAVGSEDMLPSAEEDENSEDDDDVADEPREVKEGETMPNQRRGSRLFSKRTGESDGGSKKTSNRISGWFRRQIGGADGRNGLPPSTAEDVQQEVLESSEYCSTDYEMESSGDLRFCPACLELNDHRKEGKRRVLYFMPVNDVNSVPAEDGQVDPQSPRLRAYSEIAKTLILASIPRMYKNKRLSNNEKRRRQIVETYKATLKQAGPGQITRLNQFLAPITEADRSFLSGNQAVQHKSKNRQVLQHSVDDSWEGSVALATSRRHWTEQHVVLTKAELTFYRCAESKKAVHRIPLSAVSSVQPMRLSEVPMTGFSFFQVETFSRIYYFMVRSDMQLNDWIQAFITLLGGQIMRSPFDPSHSSADVVDGGAAVSEVEDELYIAKSACWKLDKKRLFNYRRIVFNPQGLPEKWRKVSPVELIESILATAFSISHFEQHKTAPDLSLLWVKFLDEVSLLQTVDLSLLCEKERMVFFLNLYHVMVIHGNMTIGPPPAWNYWNAFFNHITYLVGYEVISIADVDHNLLRASMSRPSSLSIIPVPQTQFPGMAISHRDFRLNFCINNGSKSMPNVVPIYKAHLLDRQLDDMTTLNVASSVEVDVHKRTVVLPKVPLHDFAPRRASNATAMEYLRSLLSYVKREDKLAILKMLSDGASAPVIRFKNPSLRCRIFQVLSANEGVQHNKGSAGSRPTDSFVSSVANCTD